jgi:transposase-like protein
LALVGEANQIETFEVTCPHCKKSFEAQLIDGSSAPYRGFKCPHCRLFVPYERANGDDAPAAVA